MNKAAKDIKKGDRFLCTGNKGDVHTLTATSDAWVHPRFPERGVSVFTDNIGMLSAVDFQPEELVELV